MKRGSVSPKGQVTIPLEFRRRLGITPQDYVEFALVGDSVTITLARSRLKQIARSVPALSLALSDRDVTSIAADEHARRVASEGMH